MAEAQVGLFTLSTGSVYHEKGGVAPFLGPEMPRGETESTKLARSVAPWLYSGVKRPKFRSEQCGQRTAIWLRAIAAALIVQVFGLSMWPLLHYRLVEHVLCLEHGQLEHEGAHGSFASDVHPGSSSKLIGNDDGSLLLQTIGAAEQSSHEHEACGFAPLRHQNALGTPATASFVTRSVAPQMVALISPQESNSGGIALLALAPKLSPPQS